MRLYEIRAAKKGLLNLKESIIKGSVEQTLVEDDNYNEHWKRYAVSLFNNVIGLLDETELTAMKNPNQDHQKTLE